jgi:hypothetical protein
MHCGQDQVLLIWRAALRSSLSSSKHEKCDMHLEGVLQVEKANKLTNKNNVCNVKFTMTTGIIFIHNSKLWRSSTSERSNCWCSVAIQVNFTWHMIRYVRKQKPSISSHSVCASHHMCGTWLWQEADFNGTTSSHMLFTCSSIWELVLLQQLFKLGQSQPGT